MQYVNDDMDELFRRAAENYPLDTNSADWNKVLAALQGQDETKTVSEKKANKNGRFLWLLLLLPLGFVCNQLYTPGILNDKGISKANEVKENSPSINSSVSQTSNNTKGDYAPKTSSEPGITTTTSSGDNSEKLKGKNSVVPAISQHGNFHVSKKAQFQKSSGRNYPGSETASSFNQAEERNNRSNDLNRSNNLINEQTDLSRTYVTGIAFQKQLHQPVVTANRDLIPLFDLSSQPSKQAIHVSQKKFYAGLVGGLDATTIKFQKIENAGFSYGLLLGYQVNKKWSIESGAYLERKYYYSDAKYFNTSKIYIPPNSWIDDVSGNCKMIEVPVAAKYNFGFRKQSNWFSTLGISSYFMMNEKYTYNYYYGTVGPVAHTKEYKNSSTDWFSNISVSAGYAHKLGNFADLRVEPYLKLPISGTGIGSLPLFSAGLQLGITKKF